MPGETADLAAPQPHEGLRLAEFLATLHHSAPPEAPVNPVRGVPLTSRAHGIAERMQRLSLKTDLITPRLQEVWKQALVAPPSTARCWLPGDLYPLNILVLKGRITGIIDWGDMTSGDVATDLAALWMLFEGTPLQEALGVYGNGDQAALARSKGWAVLFGAVLLDTGLEDHPRHAAIGAKILRRVVAICA